MFHSLLNRKANEYLHDDTVQYAPCSLNYHMKVVRCICCEGCAGPHHSITGLQSSVSEGLFCIVRVHIYDNIDQYYKLEFRVIDDWNTRIISSSVLGRDIRGCWL